MPQKPKQPTPTPAPKVKPTVFPKKWTEVYPQGTKEGNEESKFWKTLARDKDSSYLSTAHLAKKSGLDRKRVEEIIKKYSNAKNFNPPLIFAHPTQEEHWGYWERVPERLERDDRSISKKDQDRRVNKHIQGLDEINIELNLADVPSEIGQDDWSLDSTTSVDSMSLDDMACNKTEPWFHGCGENRGNVPDILDVFARPSLEEREAMYKKPDVWLGAHDLHYDTHVSCDADGSQSVSIIVYGGDGPEGHSLTYTYSCTLDYAKSVADIAWLKPTEEMLANRASISSSEMSYEERRRILQTGEWDDVVTLHQHQVSRDAAYSFSIETPAQPEIKIEFPEVSEIKIPVPEIPDFELKAPDMLEPMAIDLPQIYFSCQTTEEEAREVKKKYPEIYGFKTPQKDRLVFTDGKPKKACENSWKRMEIHSSAGETILFKDDPLLQDQEV